MQLRPPSKQQPLPGIWMSSESHESPKYLLGQHLATGGYGHVWQAQHTATNQNVAVKFFTRQPEHSEELTVLEYIGEMQRQFAIQTGDHRLQVTALKEIHHEKSGTPILIMSLCQGGTLREAQRRAPALFAQEDMLKAFTRNLLEKVAWMHSCGVANMDLKPENLLFETQADWTPNEDTTKRDAALQQPVLSDFGLATFQSKIVSYRGTPGYVAPEMIFEEQVRQHHQGVQLRNGQFPTTNAGAPVDTYACDMFSVGSIIAELRCQRSLFAGNSTREIVDNTLHVEWMRLGMWNQGPPGTTLPDGLAASSDHLKDFLCRLLAPCPRERMTAAEALEHSWLQ